MNACRSLKTAPIALIVFALTLIGCGKKEQKEEVTATEPTTPTLSINCDDASIKNGLIKAFASELSSDVKLMASAYPDAAERDLERRTQQRLADINFDLQNAHIENDVCQADVIAILPIVDVTYANRYYATLSSASLAERAITQNISMGGDTRLVAPIRYQVLDKAVSLQGKSSLSSLIADAMTASAYMMSRNDGRMTAPRQPVVVVPLEPSITPITPPPEMQEHPEFQDPMAHMEHDQETTPKPFTETPKPQETPMHAPQGSDEMVIIELDETY